MASLDMLPPDQRAVLQLVLQRGRSYDEIAKLLSIERAAVSERALSGLDALGPSTRLETERKGQIGDYLLGQLTPEAADETRERLAASPTERAWARVVSSELLPLASGALPEIPVEAIRREPGTSETPAAAAPTPAAAAPTPAAEAPTPAAEAPAAEAPAAEAPDAAADTTSAPRSSRTGGAILLTAGAVVAIAVVVVVIVLVANGGGGKKHTTTSAAASVTSTTSTPSSATSSTSTATARPIAQVNLTSPSHDKKIAGVAEVIQQGGKTGLVVVAQGIPANGTHDAYAVWLYNSPSDAHILGFVNQRVKADGKLQTAGLLPADGSHFKQLLVTLETQAKPHGPGKIILQGALSLTQ